MTRDMYGHGITINLIKMIKLNLFQEFNDQIEQENNERTKINQTNKLED